ncbi:MAG: DUF2314 domain-containing protein [Phycisphaerales bacterium JB039]
MLRLRKKKDPCAGTVLFRGSPAPRPEHLGYLRRSGIELRTSQQEASGWTLEATHPDWGSAEIKAVAGLPLPPRELAMFQPHLSESDLEAFDSAGHCLHVVVAPTDAGALRDRKRLLWYLRRVMDSDGLTAMDHQSQLVWPRASLDDELAHSADVDVEALYCIHAVYEPKPDAGEDDEPLAHWVHTHGLGELGAIDFDVLRPSASAQDSMSTALRCLAFLALEGEIKEGEIAEFGHPGGVAELVGAAAFDRSAAPHCRGLRHADGHTDRRVVLCEPRRGLLAKLRGSSLRPCKFFTREMDDEAIFRFSEAATDLMAQRARATRGVFADLTCEFADMPAHPLVKLGYPIRGGKGAEHLWFEVHDVSGDRIEATLLNQPYEDVGLKSGERGEHSLELLSDWAIETPVGQINPRSQAPARLMRAHRDQILEMMSGPGAA